MYDNCCRNVSLLFRILKFFPGVLIHNGRIFTNNDDLALVIKELYRVLEELTTYNPVVWG